MTFIRILYITVVILCSLNLGQIVLERLLKETEIFLCKIGFCSITMDVMLQHFRLTVSFVFNTINHRRKRGGHRIVYRM